MSNDYFQKGGTYSRRTLARAEAVNEDFDAIEGGFNLLPSTAALHGDSFNYATDTGSANAYAVTVADGPAMPTAGTTVKFFAVNANTGASTLTYTGSSAWSAKGLRRNNGDALVSGDIRAGQLVEAVYNGSYFAINAVAHADILAAETFASNASASATAAASSAAASASSASSSSTGAANSATSATASASSASAAAASAIEAAASSGVPITTGNANKFLQVNGSGTGTLWDTISVSDVTNALDKTGDTMTGPLNMSDQLVTRALLKDFGLEVSAIGNVGSSRTFDITNANYFTATLDQNSTFTFSNPTASGDACVFYIELTNGGAFTITWPGAVSWDAAAAPTLQASGVDVLAFVTTDGGSTYRGFVVWAAA